MAEEIQKRFQRELEAFKQVEKELHKLVQQRKVLDSQLSENKCVMTELELLPADGEVYKLVGPVLVKQPKSEAVQNIDKRIEYINNELQRADTSITATQDKQDAARIGLARIEQLFQQARQQQMQKQQQQK